MDSNLTENSLLGFLLWFQIKNIVLLIFVIPLMITLLPVISWNSLHFKDLFPNINADLDAQQQQSCSDAPPPAWWSLGQSPRVCDRSRLKERWWSITLSTQRTRRCFHGQTGLLSVPRGRGHHAAASTRMQFMVYICVIVTNGVIEGQQNKQSWIEKGANTTLVSRSHFASLFRK